jgi:membrane protease YdiL (CAAX protease family)
MLTSYLSAWLALLAYLAFASSWWRSRLAWLSDRLGDWMVSLLLLPYLLATGLRPPLLDLLRVVLYLALPTVCLRVRRRGARPFDLWHVLAILLLWVPIELSLFLLFLDLIAPGAGPSALLSGFYLLPTVQATLLPGVRLPVDKLTAILLALMLFLVRYPLRGMGFSFRLRRRDLRLALLGLLVFALVGLPIGLWLGFLRYSPTVPQVVEVAMGVVGGYLLVALPEEILFRGIIQNLLARRIGNRWVGLAVSSVVFGLAHLNNATRAFPVPNWAYVLMASIAGVVYGWVWQCTNKVTASAGTHMLVNLVWGIVFQG